MQVHPVTEIREELAAAYAAARFWKKLTFATFVFAVLCVFTTTTVVAFGGAYAQELRAYRQRCVDYESAGRVIAMSSTLVAINDQCFAMHARHARILEENFPSVFNTPEGKRLRYMYEVADARRKDVPVVQTDQAIGGVLPSEESR